MMKELDLLINKINCGEIIFFAGSGISFDSGLPSAKTIIKHTCNIFLPKGISERWRKEIYNSIQPEVFYETLIDLTGTNRSLHLWRILCENDLKGEKIICKPNIVHRFIAKYSSLYQAPIITTNFDPMFELACEEENIPYKVFLPKDSPPLATTKLLSICKVHGSVQNTNSDFNPDSLLTTMTEIAKVNTKWIEYIENCMQNRHLCFVGYSGRDIDYFPYLVEISLKRKKVFWVNYFKEDYSDKSSRRINAIRIDMWPREFLLSESDKFKIKIRRDNFEFHEVIENINLFLDKLCSELEAMRLLNCQAKRFFYSILIFRLGNYKKARGLILFLLEENNRKHLRNLDLKLLLATSRLSHEVSRYIDSRNYAKEALIEAIKLDDINYEIQARCLISESFRMVVPNDYYFYKELGLIYTPFLSIVLLHFIYSFTRISLRMLFTKTDFGELNVDTQHELLEYRVRLVSLIRSILRNPNSGWNNFSKRLLLKYWIKIRDKSYSAGYTAGIANTSRHINRMMENSSSKNESNEIYSLITYSTGKELMLRNEAEQLLSEGKFSESKVRLIRYMNMAQRSGNILNEIKGIIGISFINSLSNYSPLLTKAQYKRLKLLFPMVQGLLWEQFYKRLIRLYSRLLN